MKIRAAGMRIMDHFHAIIGAILSVQVRMAIHSLLMKHVASAVEEKPTDQSTTNLKTSIRTPQTPV